MSRTFQHNMKSTASVPPFSGKNLATKDLFSETSFASPVDVPTPSWDVLPFP